MLQPNRNSALRPSHFVGSAVAVVIALAVVTIVVHAIFGLLSFLAESVVVVGVLLLGLRFLRRR